jgi:large subunit ribosomal protein L3
MGGDRVTTKHHNLISIDQENNLLVVKGAVAGPVGGYVEIRSSKTRPQK